MPRASLLPTLIAALLSSGIFLFISALGLGFIFMFLPTLPLFTLGLAHRPRLAFDAALLTSGFILLATNGEVALIYLLLLGLPAWFICKKSLLIRATPHGHAWYPIGLAFLSLALYAALLADGVTAFYAGEAGGLPQMLAHSIREVFSGLPPEVKDEYADMIDQLANTWSFLVFPMAIWLWGIVLYVHGWAANYALSRKHLQQRPDFAIRVFEMPGWVLTLMAICALASLIGSESMRFAGQVTLIALLLPYFFLGCALMHGMSKTWPNRRFFLFLIYFMVLAQFWPAMIIAGIGLWHQLKHLQAPQS